MPSALTTPEQLAHRPIHLTMGAHMSVAKIPEIQSSSTKSFDDAEKSGLARAERTLRNVD